ncbi:translational elongation factor EF-1 alpha [Tulasnella sp. 417]|nr:translational elongation factor EF-1 alpha [Tulasnella sp. 417]
MAPAAISASAPAPATTTIPTPIKPTDAPVIPAFNTQALFASAKKTQESAAADLVALALKNGPAAFIHADFATAAVKALNDKKSPAAREGAAKAISTFATKCPTAIEPIVVNSTEKSVMSTLLETFADKMPVVAKAAVKAVKDLTSHMSPWATATLMPVLLKQIKENGKYQVKIGCLEILDNLVTKAPAQVSKLTPDIIPVLAEAVWDTKAEVKKAAKESLTKTTSLVSNKDVEKFIPALIKALLNPVEEVPNTIMLLSATTFVSEVDAPTLSLMVPLLARGLNEKATATRRKVAVIVDNMSKLVDNEFTVRPFIPKLLPGLIKMEEGMADPEARTVTQRAIKTLREVSKISQGDGSDLPPLKLADAAAIAKLAVGVYTKAGVTPAAADPVVVYVSELSTALVAARNFEVADWEKALAPYLAFITAIPEPKIVARDLLLKCANDEEDDEEVPEDEELGEDLCNCQFSLAYGAKILLNTATLRLKRGHRYGLCGRNGTGKSTLMRAITNGQVEGFPSPDQVRTFYVEHDIDGSEESTTVLDFILNDKRVQATREEVIETLVSVGFTDVRQQHAIGSLSGGWKMKLALARAILFRADILLLDEPTNHLDVVNVAWLEQYLTSLKTCTSIIVSHDSGFLNNVITDVLHLNRFKIKRHRGNLEAFVKAVPEAKSYYTLEAASDYKFRFPEPPFLDGVKTKEKALIKMRNVGFQYPTQPVQQLYDITLQVSLSSRVAILGPNGSGKSTLVKLLIGDMEPNKGGEVWKHPNLVIGYVAQHAFHHIDQHLDKTPLEYMLWRYQTGQGSGARIDKKGGDDNDEYDAMGNKIDKSKKKKLTAAEARKAKKDRMARRKRGEEVFSDEE